MNRTLATSAAGATRSHRAAAAPAVTLSAKPFGRDPVSVVSTRLVDNQTLRVQLEHAGTGKGDAYALRWDGKLSRQQPPELELVVERRRGASSGKGSGKTAK